MWTPSPVGTEGGAVPLGKGYYIAMYDQGNLSQTDPVVSTQFEIVNSTSDETVRWKLIQRAACLDLHSFPTSIDT